MMRALGLLGACLLIGSCGPSPPSHSGSGSTAQTMPWQNSAQKNAPVKLLSSGGREEKRRLRYAPTVGDRTTLRFSRAVGDGESDQIVLEIELSVEVTKVQNFKSTDYLGQIDVAFVPEAIRISFGSDSADAEEVFQELIGKRGTARFTTLGFPTAYDFSAARVPAKESAKMDALRAIRDVVLTTPTRLPTEAVGVGARWKSNYLTELAGLSGSESQLIDTLTTTELSLLDDESAEFQLNFQQQLAEKPTSALKLSQRRVVALKATGRGSAALSLHSLWPGQLQRRLDASAVFQVRDAAGLNEITARIITEVEISSD